MAPPSDKDLLFEHIRSDSVDVCTPILLRGGVSVNSKDSVGNTPLHVAAEYNAVNVARYLLSSRHGVQLEAKNGVGVPRMLGPLTLHELCCYINS